MYPAKSLNSAACGTVDDCLESPEEWPPISRDPRETTRIRERKKQERRGVRALLFSLRRQSRAVRASEGHPTASGR